MAGGWGLAGASLLLAVRCLRLAICGLGLPIPRLGLRIRQLPVAGLRLRVGRLGRRRGLCVGGLGKASRKLPGEGQWLGGLPHPLVQPCSGMPTRMSHSRCKQKGLLRSRPSCSSRSCGPAARDMHNAGQHCAQIRAQHCPGAQGRRLSSAVHPQGRAPQRLAVAHLPAAGRTAGAVAEGPAAPAAPAAAGAAAAASGAAGAAAAGAGIRRRGPHAGPAAAAAARAGPGSPGALHPAPAACRLSGARRPAWAHAQYLGPQRVVKSLQVQQGCAQPQLCPAAFSHSLAARALCCLA